MTSSFGSRNSQLFYLRKFTQQHRRVLIKSSASTSVVFDVIGQDCGQDISTQFNSYYFNFTEPSSIHMNIKNKKNTHPLFSAFIYFNVGLCFYIFLHLSYNISVLSFHVIRFTIAAPSQSCEKNIYASLIFLMVEERGFSSKYFVMNTLNELFGKSLNVSKDGCLKQQLS